MDITEEQLRLALNNIDLSSAASFFNERNILEFGIELVSSIVDFIGELHETIES